MTVSRPRYRVYLDDPTGEPVCHEVEVRYCDQMRAELEAGKQGLPPMSRSTAQNHTTVWVWCAMTRIGLYAAPFQQFLNLDVVEVEGIKDENGDQVADAVDPTQPAPTAGTHLSSPPASAAAPPTGSTPTSTNA